MTLDIIDDATHSITGDILFVSLSGQYAYLKGTGIKGQICVNRKLLVNTLITMNASLEGPPDEPIRIIDRGIRATLVKHPYCFNCGQGKMTVTQKEGKVTLTCPICNYVTVYDTWRENCETCE